jgi:hypothetical protein
LIIKVQSKRIDQLLGAEPLRKPIFSLVLKVLHQKLV